MQTMPKRKWFVSLALLLVGGFLSVGQAWPGTLRDNPFSLPPGVEFKGRTLPSAGDLMLQAVVTGKTRRLATINNRNYLVGDRVQGREILDIQPDRVILAEGAQRLELRLKRRPFTIRVTPADNR